MFLVVLFSLGLQYKLYSRFQRREVRVRRNDHERTKSYISRQMWLCKREKKRAIWRWSGLSLAKLQCIGRMTCFWGDSGGIKYSGWFGIFFFFEEDQPWPNVCRQSSSFCWGRLVLSSHPCPSSSTLYVGHLPQHGLSSGAMSAPGIWTPGCWSGTCALNLSHHASPKFFDINIFLYV